MTKHGTSSKSIFKKLFYDIIILSVGIFIALYLYEWKQGLINSKYLKKTFISIEYELKENIVEIDQTIPFQESLSTSIYDNINNDRSILDIVKDFGGFRSPIIRASAWNSIINNNINLIDYNIISQLYEIEKTSNLISYKTNKLNEFIYANSDATSLEKKDNFSLMIEDIILLEEEMINIINQFLTNKMISD